MAMKMNISFKCCIGIISLERTGLLPKKHFWFYFYFLKYSRKVLELFRIYLNLTTFLFFFCNIRLTMEKLRIFRNVIATL